MPTLKSTKVGSSQKETSTVILCNRANRVGRDGSVGIATHYGLDGPGFESRWGPKFSARVLTGPGAHPTSNTMSTGSFLGVNQLGRVVDSPPHLASRLKKE